MTARKTTTPQTITTADYIATREEEAVDKFHTAKAELENARIFATESEEAAEEAELELDDLEAEATTQNSTVTPAQHAEAVSALRLAELQHKGAQVRLRTANNTIAVPEKKAADVVACAVREMVPGVEVISTFRGLGSHQPAQHELPLAVVVADGPSTTDQGGAISGDVKVFWFKSTYHTSLNGGMLADAGERIGVFLDPKGGTTGKSDGTVEELRVRLNEGILELPFITNVSAGPKNLASTLTHWVAAETKYHAESVRASHNNGALTNSFITALTHSTNVVSEEISEEGTRSLTVDIALLVDQHLTMSGRTVTDVVNEMVDSLEGDWLPGLGVIDSIGLVSAEETTVPVDAPKVRAALAKTNTENPINAIEIGFESNFVYYLRAVTRSATKAADAAVA